MRAEMSKMMLGTLATTGMAAALALSLTTGPAGAVVGSAGLSQALADSDVVQLAQQKKKRKGKGKGSSSKISPEHQQQIRQHVPAEYHRYIPGMGGGGGGGAGAGGAGAAGAGGGIPGAR
jgi:hypothetical protein